MNARNSTTAIVVAALAAFAIPAHAGIWFKGDATMRQGYWDDLNCWWTWYTYANHATSLSSITDVNIPYGHTVVVTGTTAKCYSLKAFSNEADHPATVRIVAGGTLNVTSGGAEEFGTRHSAYGEAYKYGCLDIQVGATNAGALVVGGTGFGTVTNAGCHSWGGDMKIGRDAGSGGVYVHDGGINTFNYPQNLDVGMDGTGELLVKSGTFAFRWFANGDNVIGYTRIGCGAGGGSGLVQIEDGALFQAGLPYLGGNATTVGDGRVRLRGGTFRVISDFGESRLQDSMWIGAATDGSGAVRDGAYGQVSGWGTVLGRGDNAGSVYARLGNGRIVADGEGVERTLDCSAMWQVTNVLFGAESTRSNGWFAVNKGAVIMPGVNVVLDNGGDAWGFREGTNAVGCCRGLARPDLVNAVFVNVRVPWKAAGKNLGVMLLADDRSDAHADALDAKYAPLGFWKAGVFDSRTSFTESTRQDIEWAELDFRYDQSKVKDSGNRLAVLRWSETNGAWKRIARYVRQPDDFIVSTGRFTERSDDPVWGIGLFCVAEEMESPFVMVIR